MKQIVRAENTFNVNLLNYQIFISFHRFIVRHCSTKGMLVSNRGPLT